MVELLLFFPQQVLSETVCKALWLTGGNEATETAKFVAIFDKFFDLLKRFQHP